MPVKLAPRQTNESLLKRTKTNKQTNKYACNLTITHDLISFSDFKFSRLIIPLLELICFFDPVIAAESKQKPYQGTQG